jgi:DNA invertase Pin-like site-specific DNA recombinase
VTELSRGGRSTLDLFHTLKELETWRVSVIAMNGLAFDLSTPHGRMMATIIAGIAEFERELIQERIRSGIAAAKARGERLGRQPGQRPKSDRLAPKVLALVGNGRSYRLISRELGLSKNTVAEIVKRSRVTTPFGRRGASASVGTPFAPTRSAQPILSRFLPIGPTKGLRMGL